MTGLCQVRRKGGQEEKDVAAVSRGWEEYKSKFPHLAHGQRHMSEDEWMEVGFVKTWLRGNNVLLEMRERREEKQASEAQKRKVETWLRGGGGREMRW